MTAIIVTVTAVVALLFGFGVRFTLRDRNRSREGSERRDDVVRRVPRGAAA